MLHTVSAILSTRKWHRELRKSGAWRCNSASWTRAAGKQPCHAARAAVFFAWFMPSQQKYLWRNFQRITGGASKLGLCWAKVKHIGVGHTHSQRPTLQPADFSISRGLQEARHVTTATRFTVRISFEPGSTINNRNSSTIKKKRRSHIIVLPFSITQSSKTQFLIISFNKPWNHWYPGYN